MIFIPNAKRLALPDVTLIAVAGVASDVDPAQAALLFSAEEIEFGAVKLLSCAPPSVRAPEVELHPIDALDWLGYNRFILQRLADYVETPFCLLVQSDGFVLNSEHWSDEFLDYDYIGAPWPAAYRTESRVGNGGFSLRSRRLLELTRMLPFDQQVDPNMDQRLRGEDLWICHYGYRWLRERGVRFPELELASRFAMENPLEEGPVDLTLSFGFHGNKELAAYLLEVGRQQHMPDELRGRDLDGLIGWIRSQAGSDHNQFFKCAYEGGLRLQQIPEEYGRMLEFLRGRSVRRYLELGIGRGASFMTNTLMMAETLEQADAVDSCAYGQQPHEMSLKLYMHLKRFPGNARIRMFYTSTDSFFEAGPDDTRYDCVFIDADHSYEAVSQDFRNALARLAPDGCVLFHDVNSTKWPGVRRFWQEIRHDGCHEFVVDGTCGIGVWVPQDPANR